MKTLLLFAAASIVVNASPFTEPVDALWTKYFRVFNFRLPSTFQSPYTLSEANEQSIASVGNPVSFGCSTYGGGENIG